MDLEAEKAAAAGAAARFVEDGMRVGLGTGSTVAHLLRALAARRLAVRCVSTSPRTEQAARALGLEVTTLDELGHLDITIDGADEVSADGWLIKGGGAAHTREKIVAAAADRFVVVVDSTKPTPALRGPVPLELLSFGLAATVRLLGPVALRAVAPSPDGGVIADWSGTLDDPGEVAAWLSAVPGVVDHGLFPPELVSDVLVARGADVEHRRLS